MNRTTHWIQALPQRFTAAAVLTAFGLNTANAIIDIRIYEEIARDDARDIDTVLDSPKWPDGADIVDPHFAVPFFFTDQNTSLETSGFIEWPQDGPGGFATADSGFNDYGGAFSGILYPTQTGWYRLHVRSDDESSVYFNPVAIEGSAEDDFLDPTADGVEPVAFETTCCAAFQLVSDADETSRGFYLEAGSGYAIELIWQEGGGGDWFQLGWSFVAGDAPADAGDTGPSDSAYSPVQVIPAGNIQRDVRYGDSNAEGITGPGSADEGEIEVDEGQPYCCLVTEFDKDGVAEVIWQVSDDDGDSWTALEDDGNLIGTRSPSVSFSRGLLAWDGLLVRAVVDGEEDGEIEIAIIADEDEPEVVSVKTVGTIDGGAVRIEFDEPVDVATINASNISFSGGKEIVEIRPVGAGDRIFDIDVGPFDDTPFSVTIDGVTDLADARNSVDGEEFQITFEQEDLQMLLFDNLLPRIGGGSAATWLQNLERLQLDARFPAEPTYALPFPNDNFNIPQTGAAFVGSDVNDFAGFTFGTLTIPQDGDWTFAIRADDPGAFYLSSSSSTADLPPIDEPTVAEYGCCGALGDNGGGTEVTTLTLDAGEYAFEAYYFEYGGGDYLEIGWARDGGTVTHIPTSALKQFVVSGEIEVADLPDQSVDELHPVEFAAVATGTDKLGLGYQWFVNGNPVPGATGSTFGFASTSNSRNGDKIQVAVFNKNGTFSTVFSNEATLTVIPDDVAPSLVEAPTTTAFLSDVFLTFDENVDASGATFSVTAVGSGEEIAIASVEDNGVGITLRLDGELDPATRYEVAYNGVADFAENANTTSGSAQFLSWARTAGGLTVLFYELGGGGLGFLANAAPGEYPEGFNDFGGGTNMENTRNRLSGSTTYFESPSTGAINVAPAANIADNYAQIAFGWLRPEISADYRFFLASDDNAQLWLSTDDDPENAEMIANEPGWNAVRQYDDGKEDNWSDPIALEAGVEYYIEARNSEGGGGDNLAVAWTFTTDGSEPPVPSNGSNPIPGNVLISNLPVFDEVLISGASPAQNANGVLVDGGSISVSLVDGVTDKVNPETVSVTVGGNPVEVSVESEDGSHVVSGSIPNLTPNTTYEVVVSFDTVAGASRSTSYSFTTENLPTLLAGWGVPLDAGTERGIFVRTVQWNVGRANSTVAAENQLLDENAGARLFTGEGVFDVINFNQDVDSGGGNGVFRGGSPVDARQIPDMNLAEEELIDPSNTDNWAMEAKTYLAFPEAGIYNMGVNSDDGFRVTAGIGPDREDSLLQVGVFDGGRGAANDAFQSTFRVFVPEPGIYAFRFIGYEGGGGSSMEWYSIHDGTPYLINDDSGILAYVGRSQEPSGETDAEITAISADAGNVTVEYSGTLQSAPAVNGPYSNVTGASSPYTFTPGGNIFLRVQ